LTVFEGDGMLFIWFERGIDMESEKVVRVILEMAIFHGKFKIVPDTGDVFDIKESQIAV